MLGRPAAGVRALILDEAGTAASRRLARALWIGGPGAPPRPTGIVARWTDGGALERLAPVRQPAVAALVGRPCRSAAQPSATEAALLDLWSAVLERPMTSVDAGFFELGGHSFLAVQLIARVEAAFGCRLPLASLFTGGTIAAQAALIDAQVSGTGADEVLVTLRAEGDRGTILLPHEISGACPGLSAARSEAGGGLAGRGASGARAGQYPPAARQPARHGAGLCRCAWISAGLPGPFVPGGLFLWRGAGRRAVGGTGGARPRGSLRRRSSTRCPIRKPGWTASSRRTRRGSCTTWSGRWRRPSGSNLGWTLRPSGSSVRKPGSIWCISG